MAATIFAPATLPALGADGTLEPLGYWRFYEAGGTTLADVFTTEDLDVELTNPVRANSAGVFAPIWLDGSVSYRVQALDSSGNLITGRDFDPYNVADDGLVDADDIDNLEASHITTALGYTPVNRAGDTMSGALTAAKLATAAPATMDGTEAGFRSPPARTVDANETLVLNDAGKALLHTSGTAHAWTIPQQSDVAWPENAEIRFSNTGAGVVTLTRGTNVALRIAGSATDGNKAAAQWGAGTLRRIAANSWLITGAAGVT
jgi:hypothetical protein